MTQSNKKRACLDRLVIDLARCSLAACCRAQRNIVPMTSPLTVHPSSYYMHHTVHTCIHISMTSYTYICIYVICSRQTGTKFSILDMYDSQEGKNVCLSDKSLFVCLFAYCFSKQQIIVGKPLFLFLYFDILFSYQIYFTPCLER
jgi:hypothetical protein